MKTAAAVRGLLFEAYRRNDMADEHQRSKPMNRRWLGLGTAAAYSPAIKAGVMVFYDGRTPPKRCMGWLVLTDKGVEALREFEGEFAKRLAQLKKDPAYQNSYVAHYQLAGGIARR